LGVLCVESFLSLDVDTGSLHLGHLKDLTSLAGEESWTVRSIIEQLLSSGIEQKLCALLVIRESQFFCQKADFKIGLVSV